MNIKQKLILYPFILIFLVLLLTIIGTSYQLKPLWQQQVDNKLELFINGAMSSVALLPKSTSYETQQQNITSLVKKLSADTDIRLSVFSSDNTLLADSHLSQNQIAEHKLNITPVELILSKNNGTSKVSRYSELFEEKATYITYLETNSGYILRGAIPESHFAFFIKQFQNMILLTMVVAFGLLTGVGIYLNSAFKKLAEEERAEQDCKVEARTREIYILQKMTTMLNAAQNFEEAGQVIFNAMVKITPNLSGKLYLLDTRSKLYELISWGDFFNSNLTSFPNIKSEKNVLINEVTASRHLVCIDLIGEQELFGAIHFLGCKHNMRDKQTRNLIMQLSEQISLGLSNLRIKIQLKHQAIRDPLTNLYNRRFMLEGFEQALNRAERHNYTLAVLMIDLDEFKSFNDNFGHKTGDLVLTEMAELLKSNIRMEDIACRFGGEEFCIICPDTGLTEGYALAEKLRIKVSQLNLEECGNSLGQVTISTGISIFPNNGTKVQQLLTAADEALYCAKRDGRNTTITSKNYAKNQSVSQ